MKTAKFDIKMIISSLFWNRFFFKVTAKITIVAPKMINDVIHMINQLTRRKIKVTSEISRWYAPIWLQNPSSVFFPVFKSRVRIPTVWMHKKNKGKISITILFILWNNERKNRIIVTALETAKI
jgi:hypothetical protein